MIDIYNNNQHILFYGIGIIKLYCKFVCDGVVLCGCGDLVMCKFYNICIMMAKNGID